MLRLDPKYDTLSVKVLDGNAIPGAIWTHTLPGAFQRTLPADFDWEVVYSSPEGSERMISYGFRDMDGNHECVCRVAAEFSIVGPAIMASTQFAP